MEQSLLLISPKFGGGGGGNRPSFAPLFPPALHDYIVIETSQPIPSRAEEPNIASITKSTPSKSCLMDPLQEKEIVLEYLP